MKFTAYDIGCAVLAAAILCAPAVVVAAGLILLVPHASADTTIFYTTNETDGTLSNVVLNASFSTLHDAASSTSVYSSTGLEYIRLNSGTLPNEWYYLRRGAFWFNTSDIPDSAIINNATMMVYSPTTSSNLGHVGLTLVKYNIDGTLSVDDYNNFETTRLADDVNTSSMTPNEYYGWYLNNDGLLNISKTGNSGFGIRVAWDTDNYSPSWLYNKNSGMALYYADAVVNTPYLEITYTVPDTTPPASITGLTNTSVSCNQLFFNWTNPADADYAGMMLYRNNTQLANLTASDTGVSWDGLPGGTAITFSSRTFDSTGNVNATWVNMTQTTANCGRTVLTATYDGRTFRGMYWDESWSSLRAGAGDVGGTTTPITVQIYANDTTGNKYRGMNRGGVTFDTSSIPANYTINSAKVSIMASTSGSKTTYGGNKPNLTMTSFNPTNPAAYASGDHVYTKWGDVELANNISYDSWANSQWQNFTLKSGCLTYINKGGNTVFGFRMGYDTWNVEPVYESANKSMTFVFNGSTAPNKAILDIEYTIGSFTPGAVTLHPSSPDNTTRILPSTAATALTTAGNNITLKAAQGEIESGTFIIHESSGNAVTGLNLTPGVLGNGTAGGTIPVSAIDLKWVKAWWQSISYASESTGVGAQYRNLVPELLLYNDSMVIADNTNQTNWLWLQNGTFTGYEKIGTNTTDAPPDDATWDDAAGLKPFNLAASENKQVWVNVKVPAGTPAGNYTGDILVVNSTGHTLNTMTMTVRVYPFDLPEPVMLYGASYRGNLTNATIGSRNYVWNKTNTTYAADLANMKEHGIRYPDMYQQSINGWQFLYALQLRNQSGLPTDKLFTKFDMDTNVAWRNGDVGSINLDIARLKTLQSTASTYGFNYIVARAVKDEPALSDAIASYPNAAMFITNGSLTWDAISVQDATDYLKPVVNYTNYAGANNMNPVWNLTQVFVTHAAGQKLLSYNNPQMGVENFSVYRVNYGYRLYNASYDGAFLFAYQWRYGTSEWNDYDNIPGNREENAAYSTTNGYVNTIQFEGLREAIDDTRYADKLNALEGTDTYSRTIVRGNLSLTSPEIRDKIVTRILEDSAEEEPTPTPTTTAPTTTPTTTPPTTTPTTATTQGPNVHNVWCPQGWFCIPIIWDTAYQEVNYAMSI